MPRKPAEPRNISGFSRNMKRNIIHTTKGKSYTYSQTLLFFQKERKREGERTRTKNQEPTFISFKLFKDKCLLSTSNMRTRSADDILISPNTQHTQNIQNTQDTQNTRHDIDIPTSVSAPARISYTPPPMTREQKEICDASVPEIILHYVIVAPSYFLQRIYDFFFPSS